MSTEEGTQEIEVAAPAVSGKMNVQEALSVVLANALKYDGLARGLRESVKALEQRNAHLIVLNGECNEEEYVKLVEGLASELQVRLLKVSDPKQLGEMAGLCKIDRDGNARKVVGCSCLVVTNFGEESEALQILLESFQ